MLHGNQRFFASTRGRIVTLLRRSSSTVDELAQTLDLTDNAVRAHLATLERDGLVRQQGERRNGAKPAYVYDLTVEAEHLFPKPYDQVLLHLLDVLHEKVTPPEREELLRATAHRFAATWSLPGKDVQGRLEWAVKVLNELGGLVELEQSDRLCTLHGYRCPFAAVVPDHPEVCHLAEMLLTELAGVEVEQQCDGSGSPHCTFIVQWPGSN